MTFSLKESVTFGSVLYSSSVYCCHISFTSFPSVTTFPVLSFMAPHIELWDPVISLMSLVLPIILLSLQPACIPPLCFVHCIALLWKTASSLLYSLSSPLVRTSLRSSEIFTAWSDNHFVTFFLLAHFCPLSPSLCHRYRYIVLPVLCLPVEVR